MTIPKSFKKVGNYAFKSCKKLQSIVFEKGSLLTEIGNSFCQYCSTLQEIQFPTQIISIGNNAFSGCSNLESINLPETIEKIGTAAFDGCTNIQQTTLILRNIKELGDKALSSIPLTTVVVGPHLPTEYLSFESFNMVTLTNITLFSSFFSFYDSYDRPEGAMMTCATPKEDIIEYVEYVEGEIDKNDEKLFDEYINLLEEDFNIDVHSLTDCNDLTGFEFNRLTGAVSWFGAGTIRNKTCFDTIKDKSQITSMTFAPTITGIDNEMFMNLTMLSSITMSSTMNFIGKNAFAGCSRLVFIKYDYFEDGVVNCTSNAFDKRLINFVIIENYQEQLFCGITTYNTSEYAPNFDDSSSNDKPPLPPYSGGNSIMKCSLFLLFMMLFVFI